MKEEVIRKEFLAVHLISISGSFVCMYVCMCIYTYIYIYIYIYIYLYTHSLQKLKTRKYFKMLNFNTLLFANDQFIISDTEDNLQKAVYLLYNISKEYNLEIATKKTKVFGFFETDHLRTKIIINDETLEQVTQFTYLGCSISYQFSSDVEFKLAKFLQLIGTIKRIILKKVTTETILKIYNTLVLPTFLYGSENWTLTALQRRRIEAAEMKLLRPLAGYNLYDHKTNDYISRELRITGILDKIRR